MYNIRESKRSTVHVTGARVGEIHTFSVEIWFVKPGRDS
jgi:hypothetical protein